MTRPAPARTHLGAMLLLYRTVHGVTVRDLAVATGISYPTLSRIERGHAMDVETWIALQRWLFSVEAE